MLITINTPNATHTDERGHFTQLVREGYRQINVVFSKGGAFRGNHYHANNVETFYIISGALNLAVAKDGVSEAYQFRTGDMFSIPPYVTHNFNYIEDTYLVSMYDKGVESPVVAGGWMMSQTYIVSDIIQPTSENT